MKCKKANKILFYKGIMSFFIIFLFVQILKSIILLYIKVLEKCFNKNYGLLKINNIIDYFNVVWNNKIIGAICFIIVSIFVFLVFNIYFTRKRLKFEKEGINFKQKDGTHGTANFTTAQEIDILDIGKEELTNGILLGKTLDTDEIITLPDTYNAVNRNIMVWGASGSRKINKFYNTKCIKDYRPRKKNKRTRKDSITR